MIPGIQSVSYIYIYDIYVVKKKTEFLIIDIYIYHIHIRAYILDFNLYIMRHISYTNHKK